MVSDTRTAVLSNGERISLLKDMLRIRAVEEKVVELYFAGETAGTMFHLSEGEEGVPAGVISHLGKQDYVTSHHRGHGIAVAKGINLVSLFAEIIGRSGGICGGRGGSMHIADYSVGHINSNAIVGGNIGYGTGAGLSIKRKSPGLAAVNFFGDGALNEGVLYECMNMAALWKLPVFFVCINNQYGMGTRVDRASASQNFVDRARTFGLEAEHVDAMDVEAVASAAGRLLKSVRDGQPAFLECECYRFYGHGRKDASPYRSKEEEAEWRAKDPIVLQQNRLMNEGLLFEGSLQQLNDQIQLEVDAAADTAMELPGPTLETLTDHVYAVPYPSDPDVRRMGHMFEQEAG